MKSGWIWLPKWSQEKETQETFVFFRKNMELLEVPESFRIRISADSRYKLYINGQFCEAGPSKGNDRLWFYDEVETAPYLKKGSNDWMVVVLHYTVSAKPGNHSIFRTATPGLYLESCQKDEAGQPVFCTDESWKAKELSDIQIVSENPFFAPLQIYEAVTATEGNWTWRRKDTEAEKDCGELENGWMNAWECEAEALTEVLRREKLAERTIPFLKKIPRKFKGISKVLTSQFEKKQWEGFLAGENALEIPAHSQVCVDVDAGELMTGYLFLKMMGGQGAKITLLQSESYVMSASEKPDGYGDLPIKKDRADAEHGFLTGFVDTYQVCGEGTGGRPEIYEPFWFRTFRYIQIKITTGEEPLTLQEFTYRETGYPLEIKTHVETSDPALEAIWDISARTLRRCMHETYEDCPFYEQIQYAMDSRNQILYTYATAADDRLARKCMEDFRYAQREDGLLNSCYPLVFPHVIPGFSIYYIGMVYDHMMYFGDRELVKRHLQTIAGILGFYQSHLDEKGLVEKIGGLNRPGNHWSFIDWTPEWDATNGVPSVTLEGQITMESFLYLLGLQYAKELALYAGEEQTAETYGKQAEALKLALNTHCRGKNGMYQDGPGKEVYSQHCQVFAVLTDTVSLEEGKAYILETLDHKENYAQCSVAIIYYLFRALEKCGVYERTEELWEIWKVMVENHMTTCAEDPLLSRSDCHAWGALALYELPSVLLGVRPAAPGYRKVKVQPHTEYLHSAKGTVLTPVGTVSVKWQKDGEKISLEVDAPEGVEVIYES